MTDVMSWIIFLGCFSSSFFLKFSPVLAIIGSVIIGVTYKLILKRCENDDIIAPYNRIF